MSQNETKNNREPLGVVMWVVGILGLFIAVLAVFCVVAQEFDSNEVRAARFAAREKSRMVEVVLSDGTRCVVHRGKLTCPTR